MGGVPQPVGNDLNQIVGAIQKLNIFVAVTDIDSVRADMVKAQAVGEI